MDKTERKDVKVLKGFAELVPVHVAVNACCGQPFHHKVSINLPDGAGAGSDNLSLPPGKRLVIEFATISAFVPLGSGQKPFAVFQTTTGGVSLSLPWCSHPNGNTRRRKSYRLVCGESTGALVC